MKRTFQKAIVLCTFLAGLFLLNSCKKTNEMQVNDTSPNLRTQDEINRYIKSEIDRMGGIPEVFPINRKVTSSWKENNIPAKTTTNRGGPVCTNFDDPDYINFIQYQRIYSCLSNSNAGGYVIQTQYELSWSKVPVAINALGATTAGSIYVEEDATSTTVATYTAGCKSIVDLGVDPVYAPNHKYRVTFEYGQQGAVAMPKNYINGLMGTYTIKFGASFATSCPDNYTLWTLPVSMSGFTSSTGLNPCKRAEYVFFLPPGSGNTIGVSSFDAASVCTGYASPFVKPDLIQVEYSTNGSMFMPFENGGGTTNPILLDGYLTQYDNVYSNAFSPGTYSIVIRHRNWKYGTYPTTGPLTVPTTLSDCHTVGNTADPDGYGSWAYMYYTVTF